MSKKLVEAQAKVEAKAYGLNDAINLVKEVSFVNFDGTIEVTYKLGLDPKQSDQAIRGAVALPNGTGKNPVVVVVAKGDKIKEAEAAGADFAGDTDIVEKIQKGWLDFDVLIATPDMMAEIGKVGKILGPKKLMPNPKTGTVTADVANAVAEVKKGKVEYKMDKDANVHMIAGKVSFDTNQIEENIVSLHEAIVKAKPSAAKGTYIKQVSISSTMGPGVLVDIDSIKA